MIMTQMKLLRLIAGHNTSFSALIRKLIGNRLVCFSSLDFLLLHCGLIKTRKGNISPKGKKKICCFISSFTDLPQSSKTIPNLMLFIQFYDLQKLPVRQNVLRSGFKWGSTVFTSYQRFMSPRCAVRGQHRLFHCLHDINAAWQSEIDTDWPASLHLSVFVSLHVSHLSLLKSMY